MDTALIRDTHRPPRESAAHAGNHGHNDRRSSSSLPMSIEARTDSRKRPNAVIESGQEGRSKEARRGGKSKEKTTQRAAHACLRCRRQKLRCLGGQPCERCIRTSNVCDFGRIGGRATQDTGETNSPEAIVETNVATPPIVNDRGRAERLKQLETSVADLLAGLAEETDLSGQGYPHLEIFHEVIKHRKEPTKTTPTLQTGAPRLPPPTHVRPLDPIRLGTGPSNPVISPASTYQGHRSASQGVISNISPGDTSSECPVFLGSMLNGPPSALAPKDNDMPNAVAESLYEAPFRSLVRQVSDQHIVDQANAPVETPFPRTERLRSP